MGLLEPIAAVIGRRQSDTLYSPLYNLMYCKYPAKIVVEIFIYLFFKLLEHILNFLRTFWKKTNVGALSDTPVLLDEESEYFGWF